MQEKKRKFPLSTCEVVLLVILLPIFCWGTFWLLFLPLMGLNYYPNRKISTLAAFFLVLGFNAIWLLLMKLCCRGKTNIKLIITLFVLAFSATILTCFVVADVLLEGTF